MKFLSFFLAFNLSQRRKRIGITIAMETSPILGSENWLNTKITASVIVIIRNKSLSKSLALTRIFSFLARYARYVGIPRAARATPTYDFVSREISIPTVRIPATACSSFMT
ncbi:MAG: hypothetical protein J7K57_02485 [Palaeococcus sp.]|uniref:hypothetical protein n=1 Tax=Palaeococcus sp. (in: euryarchaeotes) TaxID=2820298 RepID=UPI00345038D0|nr:hypothetical protein [Palaeococcus sp. (in: euryarchaeotes)]